MTNPKLRFVQEDGSAFPDWVYCKFRDVFAERNETGKAGYDLLSVTANEGVIKQDNSSKRDTSSEDKSKYKVVHVEDIAYNTMRMWQGTCGVSKFMGIVSPAYTVVVPRQGVSKFFAYYFKTAGLKREFLKFSQGLTSDTLNLKYNNFSEIEAFLPRDDEQVKLVEFFSALDEKIALAERKLNALQTLKSGLIQKIFSREIRFKREDGSNFPDWAEVKMSTMFNSIRNGFVGTIAPFYTTKETGVRYLQGTNIHDGVISDDVEYYVTQEFNQAHRKNILKEDDILMVQSGHVGDCAVVGRYAGSNCHALIVMSNANSQKYSSDFVCYYFHSSKGRKNISLLEKGNTVKHVLASDVAKLQMLLPTIEEQKKVVSVLRQMDAKQALARQELNSLILQKQVFLQQMFV